MRRRSGGARRPTSSYSWLPPRFDDDKWTADNAQAERWAKGLEAPLRAQLRAWIKELRGV